MKKVITILIITIICFAIGCSKESGNAPGAPQQSPPAGSCDGVNAKFTADLLPIIQSKCATGSGCHGAGSLNGPGELDNFTQIKNAASIIKSAVNSGLMPLNGTLSAAQLQQINCWVDNGSPNN